MRDRAEAKPEEPHHEKYARFIRLLTAIVAVPKAAIYELDPRLRPKSHSSPQENKDA
jgi:glutamine synthetase adenylyltransferase